MELVQKSQNFFTRSVHFFRHGVWQEQLDSLPPLKRLGYKAARILMMTIHGYTHNRCPLRASALTFYTLLSIVPVAAMAFGIAQGFGVEKVLRKQLLENFPGQQEVITQIIGYANSLLENTQGGLIAGIGIIFLFWAVIRVLGQIEMSLNDIWEVEKARPISRKLSDYLSIMIIGPVLVIVAGSTTVYIRTQVTNIAEQVALIGMFSPVIFFFLRLLPFFLIWVVFTLIYKLMPYTKVYFSSALIAGIIAGSLYQFVQWAYLYFQVGVSRYNAIYGSFAALPLFLVWLNLSWLITLIGALVSASYQNVNILEVESEEMEISPSYRNLLSLYVAHMIIKRFARGEPACTREEISRVLKIPLPLLQYLLVRLVRSGILSSVQTDKEEEAAYQPGWDIGSMTIKSVIDAIQHQGSEELPIEKNREYNALVEAMTAFDEAVNQSSANRLMKDI